MQYNEFTDSLLTMTNAEATADAKEWAKTLPDAKASSNDGAKAGFGSNTNGQWWRTETNRMMGIPEEQPNI